MKKCGCDGCFYNVSYEKTVEEFADILKKSYKEKTKLYTMDKILLVVYIMNIIMNFIYFIKEQEGHYLIFVIMWLLITSTEFTYKKIIREQKFWLDFYEKLIDVYLNKE